MKTVIAIMGPTACGKTDLAIALTQHLPADIISVDSALVYRGMDIGTAKPTKAELAIAPHRLIDVCDPAQAYSTGQFCSDALREIDAIVSNHRVPLLVGGTMLYFHKLLFGLAELPTANAEIRAQLADEAEKIGWAEMHEKLQHVDPVAASKIKPQDPQRISRALEVFMLTGKPISVLQENNAPPLLSDYHVITIALIPDDRAWLHHNIAVRFQKMLDAGFLDEMHLLKMRSDMHAQLPSMRVVGYRQAWEYLEGKIDLNTMIEKATAATRQLAKRQMTWLRSWKGLTVFDPQNPQLKDDVLRYLLQQIDTSR